MTPQELLGDVFLTLGVVLIGIAAVGLLRLPDAYNRANAVAKAASLGVVSVLLGVLILTPSGTAVVVLLTATALQLFTVPIASYKIGEAAYLSGAPTIPGTHRDPATPHPPTAGAGGGDQPPRVVREDRA